MGPSRRQVLSVLSSGGAVLTSWRWGRERYRTTTDERFEPIESEESNLAVSLLETSAPVPAGDRLRVVADVENHGTNGVRTEVEFLVGFDAERVGRRETPVSAGGTRTVRFDFYTYPVPTDDEFPVGVAIEGDVVETMVEVAGAAELPTARPEPELAVQPGTDVIFEAGAIEPRDSQTTVWWVDGERVSGPAGGPWVSTYYAEFDYHYHRETFDETGTHEVAAAVIPRDGDGTYAARWTVDVTETGLGAPTVDAVSPSEETISVARGEPVEFELEANHSGGSLDRVVWWLTQSDTILGVTELEGERDTARLAADSFCHTCRVYPWVICADGTIASTESAWVIDELQDEPVGRLELSIRTTNSPVPAGDRLEVIVDLENTGAEYREDVLELSVGHEPELVDTQPVSLAGGESGAATLEFETSPVQRDQEFPVRVVGSDDEVETLVEAVA
ncbi:hypothetical protein [Natronobacterium gregoryi]|uniref:CARDB domain-containing protein n=2 Tax=Natronobacterium gregoryi TaxID=44930 RepID=L0AJI1_NATGS|nr:hypothetical protein [Natronobacterium gregoryi]AFZ73200.1 hypothetical protein Natgr_2017 [Natronobacterium gregoryi SP2]ELY71342.1 hypothetical protein C490_05407 [Natronobacterium gregoryi SP2]PLK21609.1 hypothetical protein CYV19_03340 [Natronobacterium gregoryi SP2]SFI58580.1 hypothetical protein SAMN05443661_10264 [Natronobacterium gregoryi]